MFSFLTKPAFFCFCLDINHAGPTKKKRSRKCCEELLKRTVVFVANWILNIFYVNLLCGRKSLATWIYRYLSFILEPYLRAVEEGTGPHGENVARGVDICLDLRLSGWENVRSVFASSWRIPITPKLLFYAYLPSRLHFIVCQVVLIIIMSCSCCTLSDLAPIKICRCSWHCEAEPYVGSLFQMAVAGNVLSHVSIRVCAVAACKKVKEA